MGHHTFEATIGPAHLVRCWELAGANLERICLWVSALVSGALAASLIVSLVWATWTVVAEVAAASADRAAVVERLIFDGWWLPLGLLALVGLPLTVIGVRYAASELRIAFSPAYAAALQAPESEKIVYGFDADGLTAWGENGRETRVWSQFRLCRDGGDMLTFIQHDGTYFFLPIQQAPPAFADGLRATLDRIGMQQQVWSD